MTTKLLKSVLEAKHKAMKASGGRCLLWDSELVGLGARISAKSITFVVRYQHGSVERRMTIGTLAEFGTVEAARKKAGDIRLEVRGGADPVQEIRDKRAAVKRGATLSDVVER